MMKRALRTAALFLVLVSGGAIINVAVAWGCMLACEHASSSFGISLYRYSEEDYLIAQSAGVPFPSVWGRSWDEALWTMQPITARDLPCTPLWPGFAINTIFYGAILWLLFAAPGTIRRWRRIKRGLCPKCAYPVGEGATCTECGAVVQCADSREPTAESLHS